LLSILLTAERLGNLGGLAALRNESFLALREAVTRLTPCFGRLAGLERRVLVLRFGLNGRLPLSRTGVARALHISPGAARRAELHALSSLDGASRTGCAGSAGATYVLNPSTLGNLLTALGGTDPKVAQLASANGLAAIVNPGQTWPSVSNENLPAALLAIALVGALFLLAGMVLRRQRVVPLPARSEPLARRRRPGSMPPSPAAGRQRVARAGTNGHRSNGSGTTERESVGAGSRDR
jgi:hypothetical protein